jgi:phage baseplate assembly protein W
MIEINNITIEDLSGMDDIDHYNNRIKAILLTPQGSILGNRDFGIDYHFVSQNPRTALNMLMIELSEQVDIFMPEISVRSIERMDDSPGIDGKLNLRITIERNDEYDEEDEDNEDEEEEDE